MSPEAWVVVLDVVIYGGLFRLGVIAVVAVYVDHVENHDPNDDYGYPEE